MPRKGVAEEGSRGLTKLQSASNLTREKRESEERKDPGLVRDKEEHRDTMECLIIKSPWNLILAHNTIRKILFGEGRY